MVTDGKYLALLFTGMLVGFGLGYFFGWLENRRGR